MKEPADTRTRILEAALKAFTEQGYQGTSVRALAESVGLTKTAVLYHFPEKSDLVAALAEPMLLAMEAAVAAAKLQPAKSAPWQLVEGLVDVGITHRYLWRMNVTDLALSATHSRGGFERFKVMMLEANAIVAGKHPTLEDRVRASQVIAALGDPVALYADEPPDALRRAVLAGARRLLEPAGAQKRPLEPRRRGRKSSVTDGMRKHARALHARGVAVDEIARQLGVSRATLYRHLREL